MEQEFKRVIIIAPTRSTCVNIHTVIGNDSIPPTLLTQEKGDEIADAVAHLHEGGFGIVAGTGTGKTVAIRDICKHVLGNDLDIDVVTREHEATERTWACNVLVITPGVAVNWLKSHRLSLSDLIVIDEIHQTSEHLELAMALAKREGCTFVWMSATIDPKKYFEYLRARTVICCEAHDPSRKASVTVSEENVRAHIELAMASIISEKRGVAVFVPTRALAEQLAHEQGGRGVHTDFYHGGESAEKLRPFLTGEVQKPFIVFMTSAGSSSLNVVGLDTVVIVDEQFTQVVRSGGVKTLEKLPLGPNELLQMGGRVNGRAVGGKISILSGRVINFHALKAEAPQFVLGGDLERVALTCAKIQVDIRDLDLIGHIDHFAYGKVLSRFIRRGLIEKNGEFHLTSLGKRVEELPVLPCWGELLAYAESAGNRDLLSILVVISCAEQLYKLTRRGWHGYNMCVGGSDHLTMYNIVATALREFGFIKQAESGNAEYCLRGDWLKGRGDDLTFGDFARWCEEEYLSRKEIKNILLSMKVLYGQLGMELPDPKLFTSVATDSGMHRVFVEHLARVQSLDFVQYERNSVAGAVWKTQGGMATAERTLGTIRYWNDKQGNQRASIEGTNIPLSLVQSLATYCTSELVDMSHDGERIQVRSALMFAGEVVHATYPETRELSPVDLPKEMADEVPLLFASWIAARVV